MQTAVVCDKVPKLCYHGRKLERGRVDRGAAVTAWVRRETTVRCCGCGGFLAVDVRGRGDEGDGWPGVYIEKCGCLRHRAGGGGGLGDIWCLSGGEVEECSVVVVVIVNCDSHKPEAELSVRCHACAQPLANLTRIMLVGVG